MSRNFVPRSEDLKVLNRRMNARATLPSVYDDALSYQNLIYKLMQYLEDGLANIEDWNVWLDEFVSTFDTKLQDTVRDKLQELYDNGKLAELTAQVIDVIQDQIDEISDDIDGLENNISEISVDVDGLETKTDEIDDRHSTQLTQMANKTSLYVGSDEFETIQQAIDNAIETGRRLSIAPGNYVMSEGLVIDGPVFIEGTMDGVVFDFSQMTEGDALTIGDNNVLRNSSIDGFTMIGNNNLVGININKNGMGAGIVDNSFTNIRVEGFGVGLQGQYCWCNLFENIRFQSCTRPLYIGSQFNNTLFNRVSLVSFTEPSRIVNGEGIEFSSPNIGNISAGNAFDLYQSSVVMTNPYIEYLSGDFATVGSTNEAFPSQLTIISPKVTDSNVDIALTGNNGAITVLDTDKPFHIKQRYDDIAGGKSSASLKVDNPKNELPEYLFDYNGQEDFTFIPAYGGSATVINTSFDNGIIRLDHEAINNHNGIRLSNNLEVGENYTILYAVTTERNLAMRNDQSASLITETEKYYLYAFPFKAQSTTAVLTWNVDYPIFIKKLQLVKGQYFPNS